MDLLDKLLSNKIVNTNGYTRSDTGTKVHSYLRTHPKNQGLTRSATRSIINKLKHRSITEELKVITDIMTMADISLDIKNNMTTLPSELVEWTITMVLKELTNNVIKHSKANKCNININESSNNYTIIVSDNGRGFENIDGKELSSIRDRIKLVNGVIDITSKKFPTTIKVTINK